MSLETRACERCQNEIAAERIEVLPETRLCIACSRQTGGDLVLVVTTQNLGKAGSLKQTGTDVGRVELRRRRVPPLRK